MISFQCVVCGNHLYATNATAGRVFLCRCCCHHVRVPHRFARPGSPTVTRPRGHRRMTLTVPRWLAV